MRPRLMLGSLALVVIPVLAGALPQAASAGGAAIYSFPIHSAPDGWVALKAEPTLQSRRMTKVYDGTLFLVIGQLLDWKLVRFKSGQQGWILARLVGCCRPTTR